MGSFLTGGPSLPPVGIAKSTPLSEKEIGSREQAYLTALQNIQDTYKPKVNTSAKKNRTASTAAILHDDAAMEDAL